MSNKKIQDMLNKGIVGKSFSLIDNSSMSSTTITELTPGGGVQDEDLSPWDRGGSTVKSSALEVKDYVSVGLLPSLGYSLPDAIGTDGQILSLLDSGTQTTEWVNNGSVDLEAYLEAIGVPPALTISGGPYIKVDDSGRLFMGGGRPLVFSPDNNLTFGPVLSADSSSNFTLTNSGASNTFTGTSNNFHGQMLSYDNIVAYVGSPITWSNTGVSITAAADTSNNLNFSNFGAIRLLSGSDGIAQSIDPSGEFSYNISRVGGIGNVIFQDLNFEIKAPYSITMKATSTDTGPIAFTNNAGTGLIQQLSSGDLVITSASGNMNTTSVIHANGGLVTPTGATLDQGAILTFKSPDEGSTGTIAEDNTGVMNFTSITSFDFNNPIVTGQINSSGTNQLTVSAGDSGDGYLQLTGNFLSADIAGNIFLNSTGSGSSINTNSDGDTYINTNGIGGGDIQLNPAATYTVKLGQNLDAQSHTLTNLADPTNPQDSATKNYVDTNSTPQITPGTITAGFNCGSLSGTNDVTADIVLKKTGNQVTMIIQNFSTTIVNVAGSAFVTSTSALINPIPASYRPVAHFQSPCITKSSGISSTHGFIEVLSTGDIAIYYQPSATPLFPTAVAGGLGDTTFGNTQSFTWFTSF